MIDWERYTLLAQIFGGLIGIGIAWTFNWFFERRERKKLNKEFEEYKKRLREQYK
jgi:hypothetical protein